MRRIIVIRGEGLISRRTEGSTSGRLNPSPIPLENNIPRPFRAGLLIFLVLVVMNSLPLEAQLFEPFTTFRVIRTEHFDIIFPPESESSARRLASFADHVYEQMILLLGIDIPGRIPVTFAPHTDLFNGYYNPIPYPSIVLFDTPMNVEWTTFENNLKGLFVHELAHAVSLNTRGPFFRFLQRIFGNWATPSALFAPAFMVEGVTIAFESLGGFGRSNDPRVRQILRQAVHEDRFPTPFQVSGVHDYPGQRGNWYEYGGLFSTWLIENYGMEKYAELWQAIGRTREARFSFFVYRSGFYRIFQSVYGMNFTEAWNRFRETFALDDIEENHDEIFPLQRHFFAERRSSISAIAAQNNSVFVLSSAESKVRVYDTITGNIRDFNTSLFFTNDIDVSADGGTVLISGYQMTGDRYRAVVIEHDAFSGRRTGRTIQGLYRARYFRDGVIGIRSQLHNTKIVFEGFNGNSEVLFIGNESLMFSGPQVLDDDRIVFVAARNGVRELLLYNYVSGELFRVESAHNVETDNYAWHKNIWSYMRSLGVSDGKIFFSHNADDRMYKLSYINIDTMQAVLSDRDFSGGVFNPVAVNGVIYYRAAFFSGDGFLRFPETVGTISGTQIDLTLIQLNSENFEPLEIDAQPQPPITTAFFWDYGYASPFANAESRPFIAVSYMNPFQFWLPLPLVRTPIIDDRLTLRLDGGGIFTVMMDPTDRHLIIVMAYADVKYRMAAIESFFWQNTALGFPLTLEFSDTVLLGSGNLPYRETFASLTGSFTRFPRRWGYGLSLAAGYFRQAWDDGGASAYDWSESRSGLFYSVGISFSNINRRQHEMFGTGVSFSLRGINFVDDFQASFAETFNPRFDAVFRANTESRFPINLTLYGAYDMTGTMNLHGVSDARPTFESVASEEYPVGDRRLNWLAGSEVALGLFSFEIQNNFSHIYFNRIFGALALRSVLYDSGEQPGEGLRINDSSLHLAQSLVLRLGMVTSAVPVTALPIFLEPNAWLAWRFSNAILGEGKQWAWGFGINLRY